MSEIIIRIILILTAGLYYASFALTLSKKKKAMLIFHIAAVTVNIGMVVYNYVANLMENGANYAPFVSIYQILIALGVCFSLICLLIEKICRIEGYRPYFLIASAIVMTGPCFMDIADVWAFPPALQSVYFVPHIFCYMLSYCLSAVAFLIVLNALLTKKNHDEVILACLRTSFPFMTAAMFMGAVWADQVWGEFWAWDIKECWALVTWLDYMLALHFYRRSDTKKIARILVITGLILVIITFLFSNVLDVKSMHSY